jgi:transketolase
MKAQALSVAQPDAAAELRALRQWIIETSATAGEGHIPSAFSILDILWVLYEEILTINPRDPRHEDRDRFILSKGHGCLGLYAILARKGFFPFAALADFAKFDSAFGGHPDCTKLPGVEASTGSLGHGFPIAVGCALGMRIRRLRHRVFCLIGDGEANEGSIWEAAMLAANHHLSNLLCIIDYNHSTDRALALGDIGAKFAAFGWIVRDVDGHDHTAIRQGLALDSGDAPVCVVAHTVKGFGCPPIENQPAWHHRVPTQAEVSDLVRSLV